MRVSTKVFAVIKVDNTGTSFEVPVIITDEGLLQSFAEYVKTYRNKSASWQNKAVQAMQLLLEYCEVNNSAFSKPTEMFAEFSNALFTGTVDTQGDDPSGLYWKARQQDNAKALINHVAHYTDWLAKKKENEGLRLNPYRQADSYEEQLNQAAYYQRRDHVFLSHLWKTSEAQKSFQRTRMITSKTKAKPSNSKSSDPKAFPENRIDELLERGFVRYGKEGAHSLSERCNLQNICITLLMHYGALRISEPMHLFLEDIEPTNDGSCRVRVFHPEQGLAPDGKSTRQEYLKRNFGLKPRTELRPSASQYSGWKEPMLTDSKNKCFEVVWFPELAGKVFRMYWNLYLAKQRKVNPERKHPYAFTGGHGNPVAIRSYQASHARAVNLIGLVVDKLLGTTPHGHRHACGRRARDAELDLVVIKTIMHHNSEKSSEPYTELSETNARKKMAQMDNKISREAKQRLQLQIKTFEAGEQE